MRSWKLKIIAIVASVSLFVGLLGGSWYAGSQHGKESIQSLWNDEKQAQASAIEKLEQEIAVKEDAHRAALEKNEADFNKKKGAYEKTIADIQLASAERVRQSEARAEVYRRKAEGSPSERDSLASYAAQLDRALEEGRSLEQEYRATLEQRDRELILLGNQIQEDRKLYE